VPLPRFDRLPSGTRATILAVAREHFARDGRDGASFNQIIAAAGISKTSAYHYFDGKDDLFAAVVADAAGRTRAALGPWAEAGTGAALWEQVAAGAGRLVAHLRDHPDDRAVLALAPRHTADGDPWIGDLIGNALRLGLIAPEPDPALVAMATVAVVDTVDDWALDRPGGLDDSAGQALTVLLRRLWGA
jgi:TetR/AcrR family transcriptional regulator of autoinduction and epiphytic fitness